MDHEEAKEQGASVRKIWMVRRTGHGDNHQSYRRLTGDCGSGHPFEGEGGREGERISSTIGFRTKG